MKINRTIFFIALVLFALGSAGIIQRQANRISELKEEKEQLQTLADDTKHTAEIYMNMHGLEVSKNKVLDLSRHNAQALRATDDLNFIKEFAGIKKNMSNLEAAYRYQAQVMQSLRLSNRDTIIYSPPRGDAEGRGVDTLRAQTFGYIDTYNEVRGYTAGDTTVLSKIKIDVPLVGVIYQGKRTKKFLFFRVGKRETITELTSPNPWVKIKDQQYIKIQKR